MCKMKWLLKSQFFFFTKNTLHLPSKKQKTKAWHFKKSMTKADGSLIWGQNGLQSMTVKNYIQDDSV